MKKLKFKAKYIITPVISLIVAAAIIFGLFSTTAAEAGNIYVSDIRVGYGHSEADAKKQLEDAGYTVVPVNLSKSCSNYERIYQATGEMYPQAAANEDYGYSYIGYKTTTEVKYAITDMRLMNMNYGYKTLDYRTLAESWNANIAKTAYGLKQSVALMKKNYDAGSPLARAGKYILDLFFYKDASGNSSAFGDWLFDSARTDTEYKDLILITNTEVMSYIYNAVMMGVADSGNSDFGSRFTTALTYNFESVGEYESYDKQYWDNAKALIPQIKDYAENCKKAKELYGIDPADDEALKSLKITLDTGDAKNEEEAVNDILAQNRNELKEKTQNYYLYLLSYNTLSKYAAPSGLNTESFGNVANLAEYLCNYGNTVNADNLTDSDVRYLYPFVSSLSEGASSAVAVSGILSASMYLGYNTEENANKIISDAEQKFTENVSSSGSKFVNSDGKIDIFIGTDRSLYDREIALTSTAIQQASASGEYDEITADISNFERGLLTVIRYVACIACFVVAAAILVNIGLNIAFGASFGLLSATMVLAWGGTFLAGSATTAMMVGSVIGAVALAAVVVVAAVIVVCALVYGIYKLLQLFEEEEKKELDPVPNIMVDYNADTDRYVAYEPVLNFNDEAADLGQYKKDTWDVFYYTKSSAAGSPILVSADGTLFLSNSTGITPGKTRPVARFDQFCAANLGMYAEDSIYFYFYSVDSLLGKEGGSAEEKGIFISHISLKSGKNAREVQLELIKSGYTFIDLDLTPNAGLYTYIGIKTTSLESEAVRDIRVLFGETVNLNTSASFGDFSYTNAGAADSGIALFYTKMPGAGSPIYADLLVTKTKTDAPEGWEPVNLFCGGDAFNLGSTKSLGSSKWNSCRYIYFHPKQMFTGEKKYVSGFAFFTGSTASNESLEQYAADCGFEAIDNLGSTNICSGATASGSTLMFISKTANPYRAISDIKLYTASQSAQYLPDTISVAGKGSYTACDVFTQVGGNRGMRASNAYVTNLDGENRVKFALPGEYLVEYETRIVLNEEGEYDDIVAKGMYVLGPGKKLAPLAVSDLLASLTDKTVDGYKPVTEISDFYGTQAKNIVFEFEEPECYVYENPHGLYRRDVYTSKNTTFKTHLYLHIKGSQAVRQKYVAAVYVVSSDTKDYSDDNAILTALSKYGEGTLIHTNIAKSTSSQSYTVLSSGKIDYRKISGNTSYIYVTYTKTKANSLRELLIYPFQGDNLPPEIIEQDKVVYTRCGDAVNSDYGKFCIYSVQNAAFGLPMTDVALQTTALVEEYRTAVNYDGTPVTNLPYYIQYKPITSTSSSDTTYITALDYEANASLDECVKALYLRGSVAYVRCKATLSSDYCCIGYKTTLNKKNPDIITGIKGVISDTPLSSDKTVDFDGVTYKMECTKDLDSVNAHTYIFATRTTKRNPVTEIFVNDIRGGSPFMPFATRIYTEYMQSSGSLTGNPTGNFAIYYKTTGYWSLSRNNLVLNFDGDMPEYGSVLYKDYFSESGAYVYDNFRPVAEWDSKADKIKTVTVNEKVTNLPRFVLEKCTKMTSITVLNPKLNIADKAIPDGVKIIAAYNSTAYSYYLKYKDTSGLTFEPVFPNVSGKMNSAVSFTVADGVLTVNGSGSMVPDTAQPIESLLKQNGYTDSTLAQYLSSVTELYIASGITDIPAGCFDGLTALKKITIPATVTSIAAGTFANVNSAEFLVSAGSAADNYVKALNAGKSNTISYLRDNGISITSTASFVIGGNILIIYGKGDITSKFLTDEENAKYNIESITVEEGITSLPEGVFAAEGCLKGVKSVSLPSTLKSIPKDFCFGQSELESINLPSKITSVGANAFAGCGKLFAGMTVIPISVKTIGEKAFYNVSSEAQLVVQNLLADIAEDAFDSGSEFFRFGFGEYIDGADSSVQFTLTTDSVVISGNGNMPVLTESGLYASPWAKCMKDYGYAEDEIISYLASVKTILIEEGVTSVGIGYFDYLTGVTKIDIRNANCTFEASAFKAQTKAYILCDAETPLFDLTVRLITGGADFGISVRPKNTVKINDNAYYMLLGETLVVGGTGDITENFLKNIEYGTNIKHIIVNYGITSLPSEIFSGYSHSWLEYVTDIFFPLTLTSISEGCCKYQHSLTYVRIPDSVTAIYESAFYGCSEVWKTIPLFVIPEGVTEIGKDAFDFWNCNVTVVVPEKVKTVGNFALSYAKQVIFLGDPQVADRAFSSSSLVYAREGSSVVSVAKDRNSPIIQWSYTDGVLVYNATSALSIPDGSENCGYIPFEAETLKLCGTFKTIGKYAFSGAKSLKTAEINCGVNETISTGVFSGCTGLESISLSNNYIWGVAKDAFTGCSAKIYCNSGTTTESKLTSAGIEHSQIKSNLLSSAFTDNPSVTVMCVFIIAIPAVGAVFVIRKRIRKK